MKQQDVEDQLDRMVAEAKLELKKYQDDSAQLRDYWFWRGKMEGLLQLKIWSKEFGPGNPTAERALEELLKSGMPTPLEWVNMLLADHRKVRDAILTAINDGVVLDDEGLKDPDPTATQQMYSEVRKFVGRAGQILEHAE